MEPQERLSFLRRRKVRLLGFTRGIPVHYFLCVSLTKKICLTLSVFEGSGWLGNLKASVEEVLGGGLTSHFEPDPRANVQKAS